LGSFDLRGDFGAKLRDRLSGGIGELFFQEFRQAQLIRAGLLLGEECNLLFSNSQDSSSLEAGTARERDEDTVESSIIVTLGRL